MAKPTVDLQGFWDRVNTEIRLQGRKKTDIAEKCGFDRKILSEKRNMSVSFLGALCKELEISADYLLFGNDWEMEE